MTGMSTGGGGISQYNYGYEINVKNENIEINVKNADCKKLYCILKFNLYLLSPDKIEGIILNLLIFFISYLGSKGYEMDFKIKMYFSLTKVI